MPPPRLNAFKGRSFFAHYAVPIVATKLSRKLLSPTILSDPVENFLDCDLFDTGFIIILFCMIILQAKTILISSNITLFTKVLCFLGSTASDPFTLFEFESLVNLLVVGLSVIILVKNLGYHVCGKKCIGFREILTKYEKCV